jgi:hypothetical protein
MTFFFDCKKDVYKFDRTLYEDFEGNQNTAGGL